MKHDEKPGRSNARVARPSWRDCGVPFLRRRYLCGHTNAQLRSGLATQGAFDPRGRCAGRSPGLYGDVIKPLEHSRASGHVAEKSRTQRGSSARGRPHIFLAWKLLPTVLFAAVGLVVPHARGNETAPGGYPSRNICFLGVERQESRCYCHQRETTERGCPAHVWDSRTVHQGQGAGAEAR